MRIRRHAGAAVAAAAAWALLVTGVAAAATGGPAAGQREVLASTAPLAGLGGTLSKLPQASPVRYGATAAQQRQVIRWLQQSGLQVTHRDAFTISAAGRAGQAQSMLGAAL